MYGHYRFSRAERKTLWSDTALVEVNPSEERDSAVTWREASLIAEAQPDAPYRRELSWRDFDRRANRLQTSF